MAFAPLKASAETLHEALIRAWTADPETHSAAVDAQAAHKTARAVDSWFPAGPLLAGEYLDDHFIGSKVGYTTYQGSVSVPLWLPGQGSATVRSAEADEAVATARGKVRKLLTGVQLLDLISSATILQKELANLEMTGILLDHVTRTSRRALQAGEIGGADHDAVVAEREDLESQIADRRQALDNTRAQIEVMTGTDAVPDLMTLDGRVLTARTVALDPRNDPRIEMAEAQSRSAKATYDVAKHSYMPNPEIGVQVMRQEQYGSPWDTQVGVQFQVGLPSEAQNAPKLMNGVKAIGAADRDAELARRNVRVEYRRIRSQLTSALDILHHSQITQKALDDRATQLERAWQVGEMPVIEYLRARRAALDARQRSAQADVIWHAAIVRVMLMAGQTP
ncbi:TolC family protein [Acetobacter fallax]|nr:TolC family protein [Acetobacter fallax]